MPKKMRAVQVAKAGGALEFVELEDLQAHAVTES